MELKRGLGLIQTSVYGIGLILGAGIYAIIGEAAGLAGESILFSILIASLVAALTGLSYCELSSIFPLAEGDYIYVRSAFGRILSQLTAVLRVFMGVVSAAAVSLAFGGYLHSFLPLSPVIVAVALIALSSAINFYGIELSAKINAAFTAVEVLGLVIIIWLGLGSWGEVDLLQAPFGGKGIIQSSFLIFFAYLGFESVVNIAEETRQPSKTIPRAIIVSLALSTLLYLLVALSSVTLVSWEALGESDSPLALVALEGGGEKVFFVIGIIALFSTSNTVLLTLISTSRFLYGSSRKEYHSLFPSYLSRIHEKRKTPHLAIAVVAFASILFTLGGDVGRVAGWANAFILAVFLLVNLSLVKLRLSHPGLERGFKAPLNLKGLPLTALAGAFSCAALIGFYLLA